ncbi:hypothetical protein H0H93_011792 [Arthromyces matolae]|nr:hypothetical protein H0H93_011792 [Arthromyces matolae]
MVPGTSRYSEDYNTFKELPNIIFIHPDSFWGLNVKDNSISTEIPSLSCNDMRLPTLPTMINTITRMTFDPPAGYLHTNMFHKHCSWIDDIWTHVFGKIEGKGHNGTLSAQEKVVLKDIFPENRPHFERIARFGDLDIQAEHREERRSILRKLGRVEEAVRRNPRTAPGNPLCESFVLTGGSASQADGPLIFNFASTSRRLEYLMGIVKIHPRSAANLFETAIMKILERQSTS